ncbi:MAG: hypothetical protein KIT28_08120 [Rubrivivax sp.]|nr:hypothetical protein [Rubrivivax sp.]
MTGVTPPPGAAPATTTPPVRRRHTSRRAAWEAAGEHEMNPARWVSATVLLSMACAAQAVTTSEFASKAPVSTARPAPAPAAAAPVKGTSADAPASEKARAMPQQAASKPSR